MLERNPKLAPCPSCKKEPTFVHFSRSRGFYECQNRMCFIYIRTKFAQRRPDALDAWNTIASVEEKP